MRQQQWSSVARPAPACKKLLPPGMNATLEHFDATWEPVLHACKDRLMGQKIGIMSLSSCVFSLRWLCFGKNLRGSLLRRRESDTSSPGFVLPKSAMRGPSLVGWAKALALAFLTNNLSCAVPTMGVPTRIDFVG